MTDPVAASSAAMMLRASDPQLVDAAHAWKSAYVHVPFCHRRCTYCDFAIVDESSASAFSYGAYVDALVAEMRMEEPFGPLDAINVGGGTPSRLPAEQIARLVGELRQLFGLSPEVEISIEVNPEDWSSAYGDGLMEAGVTRVSIGAQSMDASVLTSLGRVHTPSDVEAAVLGARASGFRSVSLDLIFGHPLESDESWRVTVDESLSLPVDHVSTYSLTVEPGTQLSQEVRSGAPAPDDDIQADRYEWFTEAASAMGIERYEVSNHARVGHACRYNLSTWAHGEYVAFGMAAHDHRWGKRSRNHRRLDRYMADIEAGVRPRLGTEQLTTVEQERDRFMLGIRLASGTQITPTVRRFLGTEEAQRFITAGVLSVVGDRVVVTRPLLADAVAREALSVTRVDC